MRLLLLLALAACTRDPADTDTLDTDPTDTDPRDTDPPDPEPAWSWCPGDDVFVGPAGPASFVSDDTPYCAASDEERELADELQAKAQLRFALGAYPLPVEAGVAPYRLPVCTRLVGDLHVDVGAEGTITTTVGSDGARTVYQWHLLQPLVGPDGEAWTLELYAAQSAEGGADPAPVQLDGTNGDPFWTPSVTVHIGRGAGGITDDRRIFGSCAMADHPTDHHALVFDGGEATFDLRVGESVASTEPAAYVRAQGELDGVAFDVTDYWRLPYNPEHHHFSRHFAVLFDAPIGEACGLMAREVDPWNDEPPAAVWTVGCDLAPIAERAVSAETHTRD